MWELSYFWVFFTMNEEALINAFGLRNFEKGKKYFEEGRVIICVRVDDGLYGYVYGTKRYKVRLNIKNLRDNSCSCPVSYSCKHVVALALSFIHNSFIDGNQAIKNFFAMERTEQVRTLKMIISRAPLLVRFFLRSDQGGRANVLLSTMLNMCRSDMQYGDPERYVDRMYNLMEELSKIKLSDDAFSIFIELFFCIWHQDIGYGFDEVVCLCSEILEKHLNERRAIILAEKIIDHIYDKYQMVRRKELTKGWISEGEYPRRSLARLLEYVIKIGAKYNIMEVMLQRIEKDKSEIAEISDPKESERLNSAIEFILQFIGSRKPSK